MFLLVVPQASFSGQSDANLLQETRAVIRNVNDKIAILLICLYRDMGIPVSWFNRILYTVLNDRSRRQLDDPAIHAGFRHRYPATKMIEPDMNDIQIILQIPRSSRGHFGTGHLRCISIHTRKPCHHFLNRGHLLDKGDAFDNFQRIVEQMRVDLILQCLDMCISLPRSR